MPKILITNTTISWNKGSAAQVISVLSSFRRLIPETTFTLLSYCPELDSKYSSQYDINVIGFSRKKRQKHKILLFVYSIHLFLTILRCVLYSFLRMIHVNTDNLMKNNKQLNAYLEADLILDLSGDSFSDWQNRSIINVLGLIPAILLRKPFVFFSQSIGPFKFWTLPFAKFCLEHSKLITIREEVSRQYLNQIRIKNPSLYLAADCAFLLKPPPLKKILEILEGYNLLEQEQPLIGVSVSVFMITNFFKDKSTNYFSIMSELVDYIVESKKAHVLLIPHSIAPIHWGTDDIYAIRSVYSLVKNKKKVTLIENNHDARELKGIIGRCNLFIGSRMHANIAALSQNIPTIAIGWSHKYYGIMKRVGLETYVCNIETLSLEELKVKVDKLFSTYKNIQKKLTINVNAEQNSALKSIKKLSELISFSNND